MVGCRRWPTRPPPSLGTGLTYLNARYYDPVASRFISPDPKLDVMDPKTLDPYRYAENNPVFYADPSGLTTCIPGAAYKMCMQHGGAAGFAPDGKGAPGGGHSAAWHAQRQAERDAKSVCVCGSYGARVVHEWSWTGINENVAAAHSGLINVGAAGWDLLVVGTVNSFAVYGPMEGCQLSSGGTDPCADVPLGDPVMEPLGPYGKDGKYSYDISLGVAALATLLVGRRAPAVDEFVGSSVVAETAAPRTLADYMSAADATISGSGLARAKWGQQVWGTGADGARALMGRSAQELGRIPELNVDSATAWRDFYEAASAVGKGQRSASDPTNEARINLLNEIIGVLGGGV